MCTLSQKSLTKAPKTLRKAIACVPHSLNFARASSTTQSMRTLAIFGALLICLVMSRPSNGQISVLTQRYDAARDGLNASEAALTLSDVNTSSFGKLFSLAVDGPVFAQPLYVPNVSIPGVGIHNVLYVATEHDSVYAFDADGLTVHPLWVVNLAAAGCTSGWTCTAVPYSLRPTVHDIVTEIGITSTPVIDGSAATIFVVAKTQEQSGSTVNYIYRLHALDISTGAERPNSPVVIQGEVQGTGSPNVGGFLQFSAESTQQRPGLALVNNVVYIAFGSWGDQDVWHGWVFGYSASTLTQTAAFSVTPNGGEGEGGIWMHGAAPAADAGGYLYFSTGNGGFDGTANYSDSFIKLATPGLTVSDYFTPFNQQILDTVDLDIASGGLMLLPDSAGTTQHPHIMIGCGKNGAIYVLDRDNMGLFNSSNDSQIIQELLNVIGGTHTTNNNTNYVVNCFSSPAYWQGNVYWGGISDSLKMFTFANGLLSTSAVSQSSTIYQFPGTSPVVSANGSSQGIVWVIEIQGITVDSPSNAQEVGTTAVLHAYDATNLTNELYNSGQVVSDVAGIPIKFTMPLVVNGKVYVGTRASVAVYGLLNSMTQATGPVFSPSGGSYNGATPVTISNSSPGTTVFYTTDGSVPTAASNVYVGPVILTSNTTLQALAMDAGLRASPITSSNYTITGGTSAPAFVQGNSTVTSSSQTKVSVSYSAKQTGGNLNVVVVGWNDSVATITSAGITDSAGNVYTLATQLESGAATQAIYYAKNIATSNGKTVTVNFNTPASGVDLRVLEYSGLDTNDPFDAAAGASGIGTSSAVALNTTNASDVILGANIVETSTASAGGGFASRIVTSAHDIVEDGKVTNAGSYSVNASLGSAGYWVMQAVAFKVAGSGNPPPTIASVSPVSGSTDGGTAVTISGTGFLANPAVTFGGVAASNIRVVSSTTITATTPAHALGQVNVIVTNSDTQSGTLPNGYTYISPYPAPTVTGIAPNAGPASGGTSVTITGTGFLANPTVTFGGTIASSVSLLNSSTITATTPAHAAGQVSVVVTNSDGQNATLTSGYTYNAGPTVSAVSPTSGPTSGGFAVTLTGANFATTGTVAVTFGGTAATNVTVVSSTSITATAPAHAVGTVSVIVTNPGGQVGTLVNGFTYGTVAIGFGQVAAATPQSPTTSVPVTFPGAQTAGDLNIVVVGWNDTTSSVSTVQDSQGNTYSLAVGPTVGTGLSQSIYYAANIKAGSNTVTVTFNQAAVAPDVRILEYRGVTTLDVKAGASGNSATANSGSATTTSANELIFGANTVWTTNKAAGTGFTARIVTVPDGDIAEDKIVTTAGSNSATAALTSAGPWVMQMVTFSPVTGPTPTVSNVTPSSGPTAGGTPVTITGTNFAAGATVTIGGAAATSVVVVSNTQINATTPAGSAGAATVTVTLNGQSGSLASGFAYVASPTVTSVSPSVGSIAGGTAVTITGTTFAAGATVTIGGASATNVVVVSSTQINATTPAGSAGLATVTVTSNGQNGSLTNGFTYIAPATVSSLSPNTGTTSGGTSVTITGTNFATGATVTFGSNAATNVIVASSTQITTTTPAGSAGPVTVTVTNPGLPGGSLANGFTYVVIPTVGSVTPNTGTTAGGTAVTITGTNFAAGATVTLGGAAATNVVVVSGTQITATTPAGSVGAVTVTVMVNGQVGSLNNGFTYVAPPTVTSVSPNTGTTSGGTSVTITGTNFVTGATVTFGSNAATNVIVASSTQITTTTPAGSAGPVTVTVTNPGLPGGSLTNGFTYVVIPTVGSVTPNTGTTAGGTAVTITGTNFAAGATVTFGGAPTTNVVVVSGTQITATTTAHAAGGVTVTVTVNGQVGSLNNGFTYVAPPTVTSVSPNTGTTSGGTSVTITGANFVTGATVAFGSNAATNVIVASSTQITTTTPAGSAGPVTVTVTNPGLPGGSLTNGFTYVVIPTVGSVTPNTGTTAGGTAVTITGTNFAAGATVTLGGAAATNVVVVSGTQITATTPAHAAGGVTVTVTVNGQAGNLANGFTYNSAVAIGFGQVAAATPQSPTTSVPVTFPGAQTAGDLNIVVVGWNDTTSSVSTVQDSQGNTYSLAVGPTVGTGLSQSIYYAANIKAGSNTVTVTFNQAAVAPDVRILEYRGVTTLDVKAGASGNSATANSGSATTTSANELIFGANTVWTTNKAAGTGFTARIVTVPDGDIAEDKIVTTVGSNSATAALTSAGPWVMQMVAFK